MARRRGIIGSVVLAGAAALLATTGLIASPGNASGASTSAKADCSSRSARVNSAAQVQWAGRSSANGCATPATPPNPPYVGSPPLKFHGGPVVGPTTSPGTITVTPVYWTPGGFSFPSSYKSLINRFVADVAADSGKTTNVFSVYTQYKAKNGMHLKYQVKAGAPLVDTHALPANGCSPDAGLIWSDHTQYSHCITNGQLLKEAKAFTTAKSLPRDMTHLYAYFLPKGVETCFTSSNGAEGGSCSINLRGGFCAYHAFAAPPLVANMTYAVVDSPLGWTCSSDAGSNTGGNQTPNHNIDADTEISIFSHEIIETITDPTGTAYFDQGGNEIADDCSYIFGDSNTFKGSSGALSNQTIHAHHYFIQLEFSNADFVPQKKGCLQHRP